MIVVVDSNILFSASISPNGRVAEVLYSPWLWTGDKRLTMRLRAMGVNRILNTEESFQMVIGQ